MENHGLNSFKKNFSWNLIGSVCYSLSQWLVLIIIAKTVNTATVGLYALGMAVTAPILMLTNLQLRQVQATDTKEQYSYSEYLGLRVFSNVVALLIMVVFIVFADYTFEKCTIVLLVGVAKIIDSYSDVIYGRFQQVERMEFIGISRIIKAIINICVMSFTLFITKDLIISLIVLNITLIMSLYFYDFKKVKVFVTNSNPIYTFQVQKRLFLMTVPLGLMLMFSSLNTNFPRLVIEKFIGEEALGIFAGIAYLIIAGNIFISAVGQAGAPRLARLYQDNEIPLFKKLLIKLVMLGAGIGVIGLLIAIIAGNNLLKLIYNGNYIGFNELFILVMISGIFTYASSFLGYGLTAMRVYKFQPILGLIWLISSIISSFIIIPKFSLIGAGYTLIFSSIVQLLTISVVIIFVISSKDRWRSI